MAYSVICLIRCLCMQDWLNWQIENIKQLHTDLTLGRRWMLQMGEAAQRYGISLQLCMALPRYLLASLEMPAVSQVSQTCLLLYPKCHCRDLPTEDRRTILVHHCRHVLVMTTTHQTLSGARLEWQQCLHMLWEWPLSRTISGPLGNSQKTLTVSSHTSLLVD